MNLSNGMRMKSILKETVKSIWRKQDREKNKKEKMKILYLQTKLEISLKDIK